MQMSYRHTAPPEEGCWRYFLAITFFATTIVISVSVYIIVSLRGDCNNRIYYPITHTLVRAV